MNKIFAVKQLNGHNRIFTGQGIKRLLHIFYMHVHDCDNKKLPSFKVYDLLIFKSMTRILPLA